MINDISNILPTSIFTSGLNEATKAQRNAFGGFANYIKRNKSAIDNSEDLITKSVSNAHEVSLNELITSVSEAEIALQSMISVRDKLLSVYQEIMRMTI